MSSRSRSSEVFDACVALLSGGDLEAVHRGQRVHAFHDGDEYILFVDDMQVSEGELFEVASMFVTVRRALRERVSSPPSRSHTRLRALSDVATIPSPVVSIRRR